MMFTCDYKWLSVGVRFVYDVHIWFKPQTTYGICLWWSHVILNELQFYDVHIWCSHMIWPYMMCVYDLPYMMHICDLPLITCDDHMWFKVVFMLKCSHMMFTYDLHVYDVGIWCSHMMLGYDVHIWTCLKIIYGFPLRWWTNIPNSKVFTSNGGVFQWVRLPVSSQIHRGISPLDFFIC